MFKKMLFATLTLFISSQVHAVLIQGPGFITASTDILPCDTSICGTTLGIGQISDGISADGPWNGFAGKDGEVGVISLDLLGNFDLQSFTLWNDINVNREGVGTFQLNFFDELDNFIQSTSVLTAPISSITPQTYTFASTVNAVSKVELETLTLLTGGVCCRIEIREVAFNGEVSSQVPEPSILALMSLGIFGLGFARRRKLRQS